MAIKVLIYEDNENLRKSIQTLLIWNPAFDIVAAMPDAICVQEDISVLKPDVILMDIGLPGIDGYEVAKQIREFDARVRITAITGYGREEDRERSKQSGINFHLTKPVKVDDLNRALGYAANKK